MTTLKTKYGDRCKTQSSSYGVLSLYGFLLENEHNDTDYWWLDIGPEGMTDIFMRDFDESDWHALMEDFRHWTTFQLELLTYGIMNGMYWDNQADREARPSFCINDRERLITTHYHKFRLIPKLLKISKNKDESNDIAYTIYEEAHFLEMIHRLFRGTEIEYINDMRFIIGEVGFDLMRSAYPEFIEEIDSVRE
ncbi:hypothetical protein [Phaeocystidibacter luteus]|uniref:Uncharacterized protein n=1 Tax=Phaeocystidibacter luteus TaxID=911197 RepID=A0A6N6RCI3_9FLAO|nr:hypothetical protein [Phaeocystidibacter luteus]KAB2804284.1 hypothetical protein F8C67_14230 [Phaeocystidibacter luteus]